MKKHLLTYILLILIVMNPFLQGRANGNTNQLRTSVGGVNVDVRVTPGEAAPREGARAAASNAKDWEILSENPKIIGTKNCDLSLLDFKVRPNFTKSLVATVIVSLLLHGAALSSDYWWPQKVGPNIQLIEFKSHSDKDIAQGANLRPMNVSFEAPEQANPVELVEPQPAVPAQEPVAQTKEAAEPKKEVAKAELANVEVAKPEEAKPVEKPAEVKVADAEKLMVAAKPVKKPIETVKPTVEVKAEKVEEVEEVAVQPQSTTVQETKPVDQAKVEETKPPTETVKYVKESSEPANEVVKVEEGKSNLAKPVEEAVAAKQPQEAVPAQEPAVSSAEQVQQTAQKSLETVNTNLNLGLERHFKPVPEAAAMGYMGSVTLSMRIYPGGVFKRVKVIDNKGVQVLFDKNNNIKFIGEARNGYRVYAAAALTALEGALKDTKLSQEQLEAVAYLSREEGYVEQLVQLNYIDPNYIQNPQVMKALGLTKK